MATEQNQHKTYEDGLRDGRIAKICGITTAHKSRLDNHSKRLRTLEKVCWLLFGIGIAFEVMPELKDIVVAVTK
jgi:hypothetical protein